MKTASLRLVPLAIALAVSFGGAIAQTSASTTPMAQPGIGTRNTETTKDDKLARHDRKFIQKAAEGGMFEVEIAKLAAGKASDPNVKSFATMLVDDHTKANEELMRLANAKKVELPAALPHGKRRDIEKMDKRSGKDFDDRFVREVGIKDHEKDIKMFEKGSKDVKDADLKAWIDKTLPHLREHLAAAQKLPEAGRSAANAAAMGNTGAPPPGTHLETVTPKGAVTGGNTGRRTGS